MMQNDMIIFTDHTNRCLNDFFSDIRHFTPLSTEEELSLASAAKKGDLKAQNKLITANLAYVVHMAKQNLNSHVDINDLIQDGCEGLVEALDTFDTSLGYRFLTHAVSHINKKIKEGMSNNHVVHIPENEYRQITKGELAPCTVKRLSDPANCDEESDWTVGDTISSDDTYCADYYMDHASTMDHIQAYLGSLPSNKAKVFSLLHGLKDGFEHSYDAAGFECGISRERARQIDEEVMANLRCHLSATMSATTSVA